MFPNFCFYFLFYFIFLLFFFFSFRVLSVVCMCKPRPYDDSLYNTPTDLHLRLQYRYEQIVVTSDVGQTTAECQWPRTRPGFKISTANLIWYFVVVLCPGNQYTLVILRPYETSSRQYSIAYEISVQFLKHGRLSLLNERKKIAKYCSIKLSKSMPLVDLPLSEPIARRPV
jgi:hypothetical protein